jgi:DNA-binding MarR family transcriptional regulator
MPLTALAEPQAISAYVLEDQIGYLLRRAHQRATAIFLDHMAAFGLTPPQFAALVKIAEVGPVGQNHLGRLVAMDPATSLGVVRRLLGQGLIQRADDAHDRRRTLLTATESGRELLVRATEVGRQVSAVTLAPIAAGDRQLLTAMLRQIG